MILLDPNAKRVGEESTNKASYLALFINIPALFFFKFNKKVVEAELDVKVNMYI